MLYFTCVPDFINAIKKRSTSTNKIKKILDRYLRLPYNYQSKLRYLESKNSYNRRDSYNGKYTPLYVTKIDYIKTHIIVCIFLV